jgi:hypothetical protein
MIFLSVMASILWWAIRVAWGLLCSVVGVVGLYYIFTH